MFLKEAINKNIFDQNGYVLLDTSLNNNQLFDNLINEIENSLSEEINSSYIRKLGGYIMGNFGINQGPYGSRLFSFVFNLLEGLLVLVTFFFPTEKDFFPSVEIDDVSIFFFKLDEIVSVFFLSLFIFLFINDTSCFHNQIICLFSW